MSGIINEEKWYIVWLPNVRLRSIGNFFVSSIKFDCRTQSSDWVRLGSITERSIDYVGKQKSSNFESAEAMVSWQWCLEFKPRLLHHDNGVKEAVSS